MEIVLTLISFAFFIWTIYLFIEGDLEEAASSNLEEAFALGAITGVLIYITVLFFQLETEYRCIQKIDNEIAVYYDRDDEMRLVPPKYDRNTTVVRIKYNSKKLAVMPDETKIMYHPEKRKELGCD